MESARGGDDERVQEGLSKALPRFVAEPIVPDGGTPPGLKTALRTVFSESVPDSWQSALHIFIWRQPSIRMSSEQTSGYQWQVPRGSTDGINISRIPTASNVFLTRSSFYLTTLGTRHSVWSIFGGAPSETRVRRRVSERGLPKLNTNKQNKQTHHTKQSSNKTK